MKRNNKACHLLLLPLLSGLTCCSDRGSVPSSGHTEPRCVLEDSHTLPPSLRPPCRRPEHTRCRSGTQRERHHPGDGTRKRGNTVTVRSIFSRKMLFLLSEPPPSNHLCLDPLRLRSSRRSETQVLSLAVDPDVVDAAVESLRGTFWAGSQT